MPPTDVFNEKLTFAPETGPLDASLMRKTTVELSGRSTSPVPWSAIFVGVADTNSIEPTVAVAMFTVPFADNACVPTLELAVMLSAPCSPTLRM